MWPILCLPAQATAVVENLLKVCRSPRTMQSVVVAARNDGLIEHPPYSPDLAPSDINLSQTEIESGKHEGAVSAVSDV